MFLGINGAGFFENLDENSRQLIKEFNQLYIRVPGGSISRFHEPYSVRMGWGMTEEKVNYFFDNYEVGSDEDDPNGSRDKWLKKVSEQPNYSYMDSLIELSNEMPGLRVIYVINVFTSSLEEQMNTLNYLITNGVRVDVVEFGNEVYGKYEFDTTAYIAYCTPIISAIKSTYPQVKVSLISGNFKGRRDHSQWNSQLASFVNDPTNQVDYVTLHFYIGADLAPNAYSLLPAPKTVDYSKVDEELNTACAAYIEETILSNRFQEEVDSAKAIYNVPVIVTEYNNNPANVWCNTYVNGIWIYDNALTLTGVDILCLHNGISPDIYGMICRKKDQDDTTLGMVPRVSYFTMRLVDMVKDMIKKGYQEKLDLDLTNSPAGLYYYTTADVSSEPSAMSLLTNGRPVKYTMYSVGGNYLYSSAGSTGFQGKAQTPNMEINGITETSGEGEGVISWAGPKVVLMAIELSEKEETLPLPIAYAGEDATYTVKEKGDLALVSVSPSGSFDANIITRYEWILNNTVVGEGNNINQVFTTTLGIGMHTFTLKVYNSKGDFSLDYVTITVKRKRRFFGNILNLKDGIPKKTKTKDNLPS